MSSVTELNLSESEDEQNASFVEASQSIEEAISHDDDIDATFSVVLAPERNKYLQKSPDHSVKNGKKRKLSTKSPVPATVAISNRFNGLTVDPDMTAPTPDPVSVSTDNAPVAAVRNYKVPPLMMKPMENHKALMTYIKQSAKSPFTATQSGELIKVCLSTPQDYHNVTGMLNLTNKEYHTWAIAPARAQRVIIRGLPSNTLPDDILQELKDQGFNPSAVIQLSGVNRETGVKRLFPLFAATFRAKAGEPFTSLETLKVLLHCKVTTEAPRDKSGPLQCRNCLRVGHHHDFCKQQARCCSCGGLHPSATCTVNKNDVPTKCANCGGGHSANWGGCPYLKARKGPPAAARPNPQRAAAPRQTTAYVQAAPWATNNASTSGQRPTPRPRLEMPAASVATTAPVASTASQPSPWIQNNPNQENFPSLPRTSGNVAFQAAQPARSYSTVTNNRLQPSCRTTPDTQTPATPITPTPTPTVTPPIQQDTPSADSFNWKELILTLAQFVANLDLHPTVTMLARLVPSLIGGANNTNYGR